MITLQINTRSLNANDDRVYRSVWEIETVQIENSLKPRWRFINTVTDR